MRVLAAILLASLPSLAWADPAVEDLRQDVGGGAHINWTRMRLEVTASADRNGVETLSSVEEKARRNAEPKLLVAARAVMVNHEVAYTDLEAQSALQSVLQARLQRWSVPEVRYHHLGRVDLSGELSLQELLKPWTISVAQEPPGGAPQPKYTGVVVDARRTGLDPVFAPRILSDAGKVLYGGTLWEEEAITQVPAVYIPSHEHPAIARAGADPLWVRAERARGYDMQLTPDDSIAFHTALREARLLGQGKLVVIVDP
jgi:hypothetical protein